MNPNNKDRSRDRCVRAAGACALAACAIAATPSVGLLQDPKPTPTLEETRLTMGKWIETQQIISKERNEWQQGREILVSRLDLVKREIASLEEKIQQAQAGIGEADKKRSAFVAEDEQLKVDGVQLFEALAGMERDVRRLVKELPEPISMKLKPLTQRIPEDPGSSKVSAAERFQNVLGILNEVNKANGEVTVSYEVRELANGKPSEVRALYIGLGQAYFVSASGEAGIGIPSSNGWTWKSSNAIAGDVLTALEILQGKHTPAFVPLPVKIQ